VGRPPLDAETSFDRGQNWSKGGGPSPKNPNTSFGKLAKLVKEGWSPFKKSKYQFCKLAKLVKFLKENSKIDCKNNNFHFFCNYCL
jgi:hypothetical protein